VTSVPTTRAACSKLREDYTIEKGDRIAQLIIARYEPVEWEESDWGESRRGKGGFGSSVR
jgi:dUTP diphosphatase